MPTLTTLDVTGMTCGHCVSAVTRELETVDGVERVSVELVNGGTSHVTLFSDTVLPEDALRAAIDEAGYDLTGVSSHGAAEEFAQLADARAEAASADAAPDAGTDQAPTGGAPQGLPPAAPGLTLLAGDTGTSCGGDGCGCSH